MNTYSHPWAKAGIVSSSHGDSLVLSPVKEYRGVPSLIRRPVFKNTLGGFSRAMCHILCLLLLGGTCARFHVFSRHLLFVTCFQRWRKEELWFILMLSWINGGGEGRKSEGRKAWRKPNMAEHRRHRADSLLALSIFIAPLPASVAGSIKCGLRGAPGWLSW